MLSLRIGADKSQSKEGEGIGDTFLGDGMLPWADRFTWRASATAPVGDTVAPVGATGQPAELARPSHWSASHLLLRQSLPLWTCKTKPVALEKWWLHGVIQLPLWMGGSRVGKHVTAIRKAAKKKQTLKKAPRVNELIAKDGAERAHQKQQ